MTEERAKEIERRVFYKNVGFLTALNLNPEKMFELGRIAERMHIDLKNELSKEIEAIAEYDSELLDKVAEKLKAKYPPYFNEFGMSVNDTLQKDIDEVIAEMKAEVQKGEENE